MFHVRRINHAVLFVRNVSRSIEFYSTHFGFELIGTEANGQMAFMRAKDSENHHDLGLFEVGPAAPTPPRGSTGLYHLAWQVDQIEELQTARDELRTANAYVGESDHGATKSIYGEYPDGNEFEIMWLVPREQWGEYGNRAVIEPLDLDEEIAQHGGV